MEHQFKNPVQAIFTCVNCGKEITLTVEAEDLQRWGNREEHIQNCFPYLTPAERELFLTGICGECFDIMFRENQF